MRQFPKKILTQTVSGSTTYTSAAIPAEYIFHISAQIVGAGGAAGTLNLQASNDNGQGAGFAIANWNTIATVTVTGNGSFLIPRTDSCYEWLRVSYANTGTGTVVVNIKALGI